MKTRALLLALPLLAAACRDNRASVEIQAICFTTDDCTFSSTCSNTLMGEPAIDAAVIGHMWIPVQVANQLPNNANLALGRVNTNDAHVDEYVLEFGGAGLGKQVIVTNQLVPAAGTTVLLVNLVPEYLNAQAALAAFAPTAAPRTMTVTLRVRGYYDDGSRFETGEFPIGLEVCSGCLGACPAGKTLSCGSLGWVPHSCT